MEKPISVDLYGDGSRKSRLRAEYIYCEHAEECSAYKSGKCFNVTVPFGKWCKTGRVHCVDGGTKNSKAYDRVWTAAKGSEVYHHLKYLIKVPLKLMVLNIRSTNTLSWLAIQRFFL